MGGVDPNRVVLPIVAVDPKTQAVRGVYGSSLLIRPGILISCKHCLTPELPTGEALAVARKDSRGRWDAFLLQEVAADPRGYDLATAKVPIDTEGQSWPRHPAVGQAGMNVWSYGFPLGDFLPDDEMGKTYRIFPRFVKGYVMRRFVDDPASFPRLELDMLCPPGLSGAPLVFENTDHILGLVYGSTTVKVAGEDPARLYTFGLAFDWEVLAGLSGPATGDRPLEEIVEAAQQ